MTGASRFAPEALVRDGFLGGKLRLEQPRAGFRSGVDAVFLAAACPAKSGETVLELGCGAGVASFCLASRVDGLRLHGLELQPDYAALAKRNAAAAGADFTIHRGDVSTPPPAWRALLADGVLFNPPYFPAGRVSSPIASDKQTAHLESVPLATWIDGALRRLKPGGWLALIQRAERLGDVLAGLDGRAGDIRIKPLAGREGRSASRVVIKARKGARAPLTLFAPLIEHNGPRHERDGDDYSKAAQAILRHGAPLDF